MNTANWTVETPKRGVSLYIHKDGTVTVSQHREWLRGYYESREAAMAAVKADPVRVARLAETARQRGTPITEAELA